jgi:hypothetical protein
MLSTPAVRAQSNNGAALVIGNSKYKWEAQLPNVKRDAPDVAKRFQALGLRTEVVMDADQKTMLSALEKMKAGAPGASLAAIYFAGHGVILEKGDYLVPVDADLSDPASIKNLIPTRQFGDAVAAAQHRLLVFDNCRNNPADGWRQTEAERRAVFVAGNGNGGPAKPGYMLLASTAPGHVALDGPAGQNSPFAAALLRELDAPTVEFQSLPARIRRELLIATEGRQLLFSRNSYDAPFTQSPSRSAAPVAPAPAVAPSRIIELTKAYAFAREHKYPIPLGLVAIRPAASGANSIKVGSYAATSRNKYGKYPCLVIVLSVERGDKADVIWAGNGYTGQPSWRYYAGGLEGNRLKLFSATGGQDTDEIFYDWKSATSATQSMQAPGSGSIFSSDMIRLDG